MVDGVSSADRAPSERLAARAKWLGGAHSMNKVKMMQMKRGCLHNTVSAAKQGKLPHTIVEACIAKLKQLCDAPAEEEV